MKKNTGISLLLLAAALFTAGAAPREANRLTNPLLDVMHFKEILPFSEKINAYIEHAQQDGKVEEVAFYFRSLADGITFGINENDRFSAASLMKVPVMIAYFKIAEKKPAILSDTLRYEIRTEETRDFVPASPPVEGKSYRVEEMIDIMLKSSDNNATIILSEKLDPAFLLKVFRDVGVFHGYEKMIGRSVSLKKLVSMFRVLYNASYLNREMSEKALRTMVNTSFERGIAAGVPKSVTVSHKFGEQRWEGTEIKQLHEVAIVYYKKNPYLLGIMTTGSNFNDLCEVLKDISKITYEEVDSQYKSLDTGTFSPQ